MSQALHLMQTISQSFMQEAQVPLLLVAAYAGGSLILYSLTRGKEFLLAGYSSVLFMVPLLNVG